MIMTTQQERTWSFFTRETFFFCVSKIKAFPADMLSDVTD